MTLEFDTRIRYLINRFFAEKGIAPTSYDLAVDEKCRATKVAASFRRLHDAHRLLLYPGTKDRIWVAHPFTAVPSNYWVEAGERGWWGNCGFCSLGIAAMLKEETRIYSRLGAERTQIQLKIIGSVASPPDLLLHIPVQIAKWHDNVMFTCGHVHYFDSESAVDIWTDRHLVSRGEVIPLDKAWSLAQRWYGDYLEPDWRPRTNAETNSLLESCGLTTSFWRLPDD